MIVLTRRQVAVAFGAILRTARNGADLSQERLAELADMDRTYPSLMERGLRQPTLFMLLNLAAALKIEPGMLVTMMAGRLRRERSNEQRS